MSKLGCQSLVLILTTWIWISESHSFEAARWYPEHSFQPRLSPAVVTRAQNITGNFNAALKSFTDPQVALGILTRTIVGVRVMIYL